jgi:hypothetical protein
MEQKDEDIEIVKKLLNIPEKPIPLDHVEWKCDLGYKKCQDCNRDSHWQFFICKVCGGGEGILTTHCIGRKITGAEMDSVYKQNWDFINNEWVQKPRT